MVLGLYIKDCKQYLKNIQIIKLLQFVWVDVWPSMVAKTFMNLFYKKQDACSGVNTGLAVGKIPSQYSKK